MLPLNVDVLRAAYDYLDATPPFSKWNLPDSDDVVFRVVKDRNVRGWYMRDKGKHVIAISSGCIGQSYSLIRTMAHELIHLHEAHAGACGNAEHSAAFKRWAAQVCKVHGFDPLLF